MWLKWVLGLWEDSQYADNCACDCNDYNPSNNLQSSSSTITFLAENFVCCVVDGSSFLQFLPRTHSRSHSVLLKVVWTVEISDSPYSSRERFQDVLRLLPQFAQNSFDTGLAVPHLPQKVCDGTARCGAVCLPRPLIASTPNRMTKRTSAAIRIRLFCCSVASNPPVDPDPLWLAVCDWVCD